MRPPDKVDPSSAYVYGRFEMRTDGHNEKMGFVLRCTDGQSYQAYVIGFSRKRPLQVFAVPPGECSIDETVYSVDEMREIGRREASLAPLRGRDLAPGVAYYIGDYVAAGTSTQITFGTRRVRWGVVDVRDQYDQTTADMQRAFPNLAALRTQDGINR
jgi:hypothetical protein